MKTLTNVAVYGLVPVPASADTQACSNSDNHPPADADADANAAQLAWLRHDAAERMATNDELARILRELEALSAEPSRH